MWENECCFFCPKKQEDVLSELLSEQNRRTQRAFFRNAEILAEPEIGITVSRLRIPIINKKKVRCLFFFSVGR